MTHVRLPARQLPLCAAWLLALAVPAVQAAAKQMPKVPAGPTATLTASSALGEASITLDGAGAFTQALVFTSSDGLTHDLSYRSAVYFNGTQYGVERVKQPSAQKAVSSFYAEGLLVHLVQQLAPAAVSGSYLLDQDYHLSNPGTEPLTVNLVRYNDSDMLDAATSAFLGDWAYQPSRSRFNYIVSDPAPSTTTLTQFIGVKLSGAGVPKLRVVRWCCGDISDILPEQNGTVPDDADLDGVSDISGDLAITAQAPITVPAGGSVTLSVQTLFGRGSLNGLTALPSR